MADKNITRRLKIYVNGNEVDATITNLRKNLAKFRSASNRAVEGSDEWKKYNKEVAVLEDELKQATAAQKQFRESSKLSSKQLSDNEKQVSKFASSVSTLFNGFKTGDYLQIKEGFNGIKTGIAGATKAALAFIATPLGAFIALLTGIGLATKAWYDYNKQVVEALKLTTAITQLTDKAADEARIYAETLSEVYGANFETTLETAKKLVQSFGISYNEAFEVIEDGLKRGQTQNDEYFESLSEYGTFFDQAGYSAQEFKDIISTGYDLGIYKDKLPDALKEADLAIKEQTDSTREALVNAFGAAFTDDLLKKVRTGEVTTKEALQSISQQSTETGINVQQNAQLTADLFKGAGEDAGGALKVFEAVNIALTNQKVPLTESQQLLEDQAEATRQLKEVSSALFATGDKGFGLLIDKAKLFGTKTLVSILETGVDIYNWFIDLNNESAIFSALLSGVGKAATGGFEMLGILFSNAWESLKGLGKVIQGVFTLNPEKIAEGFKQGFAGFEGVINDMKEKVVKDATDIYNALSGKNQKEKITLDDFLNDNTTNSNDEITTTTTDNQTSDNELTKEDQKILDSKKKLAEYLKQFEEDQAIQDEIKELEENEAAQLKEELELENKYAKLEEDAYGEAELLKELEDAKGVELAAIKKKWEDKFLADNKKYKEQALEDDKKFKKAQLDAELTLQQAKADAIFAGLSVLKSFAEEGSAEYKALFVIEKLAAAAEVILAGQRERAAYAANPVWSKMPDGGASIKGPMILASKIRTGISLATIAATTIQGLEEGGYTWDGQNSGGVDGRGGQLAVHHPGEYMIPRPVMQMPEVPQIIEYLEAKRTGNSTETTAEVAAEITETGSNSIMIATLLKLDTTLQNLKINYTLQDEVERQKLQTELDRTLTNAKS